MQAKDILPEQKFGLLTTKEFITHPEYPKRHVWRCLCECGRECLVKAKLLSSGNNKTCGQCGKTKKFQDLTGMKFGKLTVIQRDGYRKANIMWLCKCECGGETRANISALKCGNTTTCGRCTKNSKFIGDLVGKKFGKLTVLEQEGRIRNNRRYLLCQCDCGNIKEICGVHVRHGRIKTCGTCERNSKIPIGTRFGKLVIIEEVPVEKGRRTYKCRCDCGNEYIANSNSIKRGNSRSCGCTNYIHIDHTGKKNGKLTFLKKVVIDGRGYYDCKCDCGKTTVISSNDAHTTKSCGCLSIEIATLRGKTYIKEKNPNWRGGFKQDEIYKVRRSDDFKKLRQKCIKKCGGYCYICNDKRKLHAHHIYNITEYPQFGLTEENLVIICEHCHQYYHSEYGYNNTLEQFNQFLNSLGLPPLDRNITIGNGEIVA